MEKVNTTHSLWKISRGLTKRREMLHQPKTPTGPVFHTGEVAEVLANTFRQTTAFPPRMLRQKPMSAELCEIDRRVLTPEDVEHLLTNPKEVLGELRRVPARKAPGEDAIFNAAAKKPPS